MRRAVAGYYLLSPYPRHFATIVARTGLLYLVAYRSSTRVSHDCLLFSSYPRTSPLRGSYGATISRRYRSSTRASHGYLCDFKTPPVQCTTSPICLRHTEEDNITLDPCFTRLINATTGTHRGLTTPHRQHLSLATKKYFKKNRKNILTIQQ